MSNHGKPSNKQLAYLRDLAHKTGTTFATPRTTREASREIERLRRLLDERGRHVEYAGAAHAADTPRHRQPRGSVHAQRANAAGKRGEQAPIGRERQGSRGRSRTPVARPQPRPVGRVLAGYLNQLGHSRTIVAIDNTAGDTLVVDQDADSGQDRRLVAHLGGDEPTSNAKLLACLYVADPTRGRCRHLAEHDLTQPPTPADDRDPSAASWDTPIPARHGNVFKLAVANAGQTGTALHWTRINADHRTTIVRFRRVVGELQSYEPAVTLTRSALTAHSPGCGVSTRALEAELHTLLKSSRVLNRRLRERVEQAVSGGQTTLSEIARRCGRASKQHAGGDTSWLSRRIGQSPEAGGTTPTPWVSSEVLALIARDGLGIAPHEAELS